MAVKFPNTAQLVGSLLLVENEDRTIILDFEVGSLTEACQIMLDIHKQAPHCSPVVRKQLAMPRRKISTGWPS